MKRLPSKRILEIFRDVVEESSRLHASARKKAMKGKRPTKAARSAKPSRKVRIAAE